VTQFDPGLLRHRVQVERRVGVPDDAGGETIAWEPVTTLWARIDPVRAGEQTVAGHLAAVVSHKLTFRWREELTGGMRVVFRERRFRILAVFDPDERRRYVVALAEEEKP
jgi:SPP1 family predicted phage head-tail adaptor